MIVMHGTKSLNLKKSIQIKINPCVECKCDTFIANAIQLYKHIYFIPIFPQEKIFYLTCIKCQVVLQLRNYKKHLPQYRFREFKTPTWLYIFPALLICFILYGIFC